MDKKNRQKIYTHTLKDKTAGENIQSQTPFAQELVPIPEKWDLIKPIKLPYLKGNSR